MLLSTNTIEKLWVAEKLSSAFCLLNGSHWIKCKISKRLREANICRFITELIFGNSKDGRKGRGGGLIV